MSLSDANGGSLEAASSLETLGLPWRHYVARLEPAGDGADAALDAALRELPAIEDQDVLGTRVRKPAWAGDHGVSRLRGRRERVPRERPPARLD